MLALTRKHGEIICIGNDIQIQVVRIEGDQVRLGIEAPREVPVHRKEIFDQIQRDEARNLTDDDNSDDTDDTDAA